MWNTANCTKKHPLDNIFSICFPKTMYKDGLEGDTFNYTLALGK